MKAKKSCLNCLYCPNSLGDFRSGPQLLGLAQKPQELSLYLTLLHGVGTKSVRLMDLVC